jgi:hypothetical protein
VGKGGVGRIQLRLACAPRLPAGGRERLQARLALRGCPGHHLRPMPPPHTDTAS